MAIGLASALCALIVWRRRLDPLAALYGAWAVVLIGFALAPLEYAPLRDSTVALIAGSLMLFGLGYAWAARMGRHSRVLVTPWIGAFALLAEYFVPLCILVLLKSLLLFWLQLGSLSIDLSVGTVGVRDAPRSLVAVYLVYLSVVDFLLCPIGGMLWRQGRRALVGLLPAASLYLVSVALGGRTYAFWGIVATLFGYAFAPTRERDRPGAQRKRRALAAQLLLLAAFGALIEGIRFLRSGGTPYDLKTQELLPYTALSYDSSAGASRFWLVTVYYWTAPLAALDQYLAHTSEVSIHFLGWLVRGFVDMYHLPLVRPFVAVPVRTNVYTWLPYFYEDLGSIGFVLYPLALGCFTGWHWGRWRSKPMLQNLVAICLASAVLVFSPFDYALSNKALFLAIVGASLA